MREQFFKFIEQQTPESFLEVRREVLAAEAFDPYSDELDEIHLLMEEEKWEEIVEVISKNLFPNHLLSPGAHLRLGFAHHKLGRERESGIERMISSLLIDGIKGTGDGTPEVPYVVTRTSDEYDVLGADGLVFSKQALVSRNGREFDVMSVEGGKDIWFDITDIKAILDRRLGTPRKG